MKKIVLCIMLFSIIAFSGCLEENNGISEEDFEINAEWNSDFVPYYDTDLNSIHREFILKIKNYHEKFVYYKVYDKSINSELIIFYHYDYQKDKDNYETRGIFGNSENPHYIPIILNSIEEKKEIDVYFSLDKNFDIKDEGVVKLSTYLPQ